MKCISMNKEVCGARRREELHDRGTPQWKWLTERPHPWRRQPWFKGRKLMASAVWRYSLANGLNAEECAKDWELPLEAVEEAFAWCEANRDLIQAEADEERQWLRAHDAESRHEIATEKATNTRKRVGQAAGN
jgi:hypothetical protein